MTFSLVDALLFAALVVTTTSVLVVYRRLRSMNRMLVAYMAASEETARARALITALIARSSEASCILHDLGREQRHLHLVPKPGDDLRQIPRP
ncbi:MAG: hypothetical protein J0H08_18265 [Rhizobiales bacterium]|nr:hypothetical protein [Hyphomicrobiales bacterium]